MRNLIIGVVVGAAIGLFVEHTKNRGTSFCIGSDWRQIAAQATTSKAVLGMRLTQGKLLSGSVS
jgi:hypothetical protein